MPPGLICSGVAESMPASVLRCAIAKLYMFTSVPVTCTWYALWETTAEGRLSIDSEAVTVQQQGLNLRIENQSRAPENPLGSYLWRAHCRVYDNRHILGIYVPREANVRSKGVVYLTLHTSGTFMLGRWLG